MIRYNTTLREPEIEFIRTLYFKQKSETGSANKMGIAKLLMAEYQTPGTIDAVRHKVSYLIDQFDEERDRPKSMTTFIEEESMVGTNVTSGRIHKYDENGKKVGTFNVKNPHYSDDEVMNLRALLDDSLTSYKFETKEVRQTLLPEIRALKATISDSHVGLDPNPNDKGLFKYEYNEKVYKESLDKVFQSVMKEYRTYGKFDTFLLQDLGDGLDGYDGFTVRRGHGLDQNMTNGEAFKTYLHGKLDLIENIVAQGVANKIIIRDVTNDNHAGSFGWIANYAVEQIIKRIYGEQIEFQRLERFIEHFIYGKHCFIVTHGKDEAFMNRGLPLKLDARAINFINQYIDHYEIDSEFIHVEKGDLHQLGYDKNKKFDYRNHMSLAPPSAYIQHNYGDSYSGYTIDVIPFDSNEISHTEVFLDYKKLECKETEEKQ